MFRSIRLKVDAAGRALAFSLQHPATNVGHIAAVARLQDLLERAEAFAQQEIIGAQTSESAAEEKQKLRVRIRADLTSLSTIAFVAKQGPSELPKGFEIPSLKANDLKFLTDSRVIVAFCKRHAALLEPYGLPQDFLESVTHEIETFEAEMARRLAGENLHVAASGGLQGLGEELIEVLDHLDALNRIRFRDSVELSAGWKSARHIAWPHRKQPRHPDPSAPAPAT